ncbi:MAG: hypothetical protein R3244_06990 [Thermoanaerobaculia bacterium]|nr:hypothetical protein [Thermoanaerobaculia bacterium]
MTARREYAFRPWVRSTCYKAMLWGLGVVAVFGVVAWWLREPGSAPMSRAFGVLVFYGALFLASLLKIWWTAGRPAVVIDDRGLAYQPLHLFRPKRIGWETILAAAPKEGTRSYRLAFEARPGRAREFFLNLAVVAGSHALLAEIGRRLMEEGLVPVPGEPHAYRRPGWEE